MSKNNVNNRFLLGLLVALAIIYFATNFIQNKQRNTAAELPALISFTESDIAKIAIKPSSGEQVTITKNSAEDWTVAEGTKNAAADIETVNTYLNKLGKIKAARLVSKNEERWKDFNLTDSAALKVQLTNTKGEEETLFVGRFSYQQNSRASGGQSYVRSSASTNSYVVNGFLSADLNKSINAWRNQKVLSFKTANIQDAVWYYPADSGFVVNNASGKWKLDAQQADSAKTVAFFNGLQNKRFTNFEYDLAVPTTEPSHQLVINLTSGESLRIKAWAIEGEEGEFLINSSINESALFRSKSKELFDDIFPVKNTFIANDVNISR